MCRLRTGRVRYPRRGEFRLRFPYRRSGAAAAGLLLALTLSASAAAAAATTPAAIPADMAPAAVGVPAPILGGAARAYVLMDTRTGEILSEANPNLELAPASLVKMMTFDLALRALKNGTIHLDENVPLGPGVRQLSLTPGISHMYLDLPPGATVPFKDLMLGMMVASGNDAALAVAEAVGGSEAQFVAQMNQEAAKLGMTGTHFGNTNGLPATGQVTTALDMAVLARHIVLTYPDYTQFTDVPTFKWTPPPPTPPAPTVRNYNHLIGVDTAVNGMKSGYLGRVGWHLVTTASQNNTELVGVVLGTATIGASAQLSQNLLNWGFQNFQDERVQWSRDLPVKGLRVWKARAATLSLKVASGPWVVVRRPVGPLSAHVSLPKYVVGPIRAGQRVGDVQLVSGGRAVATAPITAAVADPRAGIFGRVWGDFRLWLAHL